MQSMFETKAWNWWLLDSVELIIFYQHAVPILELFEGLEQVDANGAPIIATMSSSTLGVAHYIHKTKVHQMLKALYHDYIEDDAPFQVNLADSLRYHLRSAIDDAENGVPVQAKLYLEQAIAQVTDLIFQNIFLPYLNFNKRVKASNTISDWWFWTRQCRIIFIFVVNIYHSRIAD